MTRTYEKRKANGLCVRCGKQKDNDSIYCDECKAIHRTEIKADYHFYTGNGICPICRKNELYVGNFCEECLAKRENYNQKWRKKNKDKVAVYLDRKREYQKEKRAFRKENNLCTLCGKVAPTEGYMTCEPCRIKRNIQRNKNKVLPIYKPHWKTVLSEQGLCTVCGKPTYKNFGLCKNHYEAQVDIVHRIKERRWKSEQTDSRAVQGL